jgi:hypothetical protein
MIMGVVMTMLPSLLKSIVIKKHSRMTIQYRSIPDPLHFATKLKATHRKKPILSNTIDIMIVEIIVIDAPVTVPNTYFRSARLTIPNEHSKNAPIAGGIASFMPLGLHNINSTVARKMVNTSADSIVIMRTDLEV